MSARRLEATIRAVGRVIETGCTAAEAAQAEDVHVSSVRKALKAAGLARERGNPAWLALRDAKLREQGTKV